MSPRARSKIPPVAPRHKRLLHALYLAQPFLQFAALMAVLFVLGRCSPLAPSTDKSALQKSTSAGALATHGTKDDSAQEADIQAEMRDVSRWEEMPVVSQSELNSRMSVDADQGADAAQVNKALAQRTPRHNLRLLLIRLTEAQRTALLQGSLRIDLAQRLAAHMDANARRALFGGLHKIMPSTGGNLSGKAMLVVSDDDANSSDFVNAIPIATKVQLAILSTEDKAWLQVTRLEQNLDDQQKKLIESNISKQGAFIALALE